MIPVTTTWVSFCPECFRIEAMLPTLGFPQ